MSGLIYGFTLSKGAVRLLGETPAGEARERLGMLLNLWRRNGMLVLDPGQRHMLDLGNACEGESYPPATRQLVKSFLTHQGLPKAEATNWPKGERLPTQDVQAPPSGSWFVGKDESDEWGLTDEAATALAASGIEVCRLDALSSSRWNAVAGATVLPKKHPTEDALRVFAPMCGVARTFDAIDPYCGKEEVVKPGSSGLLRYLTGLAASCAPFRFNLRELRIYTSKNVQRSMSNPSIVSGADIAGAWRSASRRLGEIGIRRVVLHLVDGERFGAVAHDRFARFDAEALVRAGVCTFQVGPGFSVFEGSRLSKATTLAAVPADDVARLVSELEREPSHEVVEIVSGGAD